MSIDINQILSLERDRSVHDRYDSTKSVGEIKDLKLAVQTFLFGKDIDLDDEFRIVQIQQIWKSVSGVVCQTCKPYKIHNSKLYVKVNNSSQAQELSFLSRKIVDDIKKKTGISLNSIHSESSNNRYLKE